MSLDLQDLSVTPRGATAPLFAPLSLTVQGGGATK